MNNYRALVSLPCEKGGGDSPSKGNVAKRQKGTASARGQIVVEYIKPPLMVKGGGPR